MELTDFSISQQFAIDAFERRESFLLTGRAGTGKSFLVRTFLQRAKNKGYNCLICGTTGMAAENIGGCTLHHTFHIPPRVIAPDELAPPSVITMLKAVDLVIIDEISMCRLDVFGYVARSILRSGRYIQVILVGDLYQLPPVMPRNSKAMMEEYSAKNGYGNNRFAFNAPEWQKLNLRIIELMENFRQIGGDFADALDGIRKGDRKALKLLSPRVVTPDKIDPDAISICPTKAMAERINEQRLLDLNKPVVVSNMAVTGEVTESDKVAEDKLMLSEGAAVMMINDDKDARWIYGTLGYVHKVTDEELLVRLDNQMMPHRVGLCKWEVAQYEYNPETRKTDKRVVGHYIQYPCRLAYAMTIHKSQGQTFTSVNVYTGFFDEGMMYVALSRCRTLERMNIVGTLSTKELKCSEEVSRFFETAIVLRPHVSEMQQYVTLKMVSRDLAELTREYENLQRKYKQMMSEKANAEKELSELKNTLLTQINDGNRMKSILKEANRLNSEIRHKILESEKKLSAVTLAARILRSRFHNDSSPFRIFHYRSMICEFLSSLPEK